MSNDIGNRVIRPDQGWVVENNLWNSAQQPGQAYQAKVAFDLEALKSDPRFTDLTEIRGVTAGFGNKVNAASVPLNDRVDDRTFQTYTPGNFDLCEAYSSRAWFTVQTNIGDLYMQPLGDNHEIQVLQQNTSGAYVPYNCGY